MSDVDVKSSILASVKKMLGGIDPTEESPFDDDIIMQINGVFGILEQLGVGDSFSIEDDTALWTDYTTDTSILNMIKPYMFAKVKLGFDVSTASGAVVTALENQVSEFEFRMNCHVDPGEEDT